MGCKNCTGKFQGRCDCCYLVDGDETFKDVVLCGTCNAYICKPCKKNWIKRSVAYLVKKFTPDIPLPEQPIIKVVDAIQPEIEIQSEHFNTEEI
jgi:hypothetical protein